MADQEEDFSSLPLPDRFAHKNWKVRKGGYEDAAKQFEISPDESDPVFRPFLQDPSLWKGAVADSNVAAQQDGLSAYCAFLKYAGVQGCVKTRGTAISAIIEKGLPSTRPAAKANSLEAILLCVELDKPEPVVEDLISALSHKLPKVIAPALATLAAVFHNYGCKVVDSKPVLKALPKVFGHADKNVRAEAQNLTVELYRWLKDAMKPLFWGDLKPVQQQDLDKLFDAVKQEPSPKQERFTRAQQEAMAAASSQPGGDGGDAGAGDEEEAEGEVDVFDLAEPVDVISQAPKDLHEKLASTKWKDRKEALDALFATANVPRIKEGPFDEIARALAKCMKDANVAVVTVAANTIEALAKGLRKGFGKYRPTLMAPMLERLKEKKQSVSDALGLALDAVFTATSLSECLEEVLEFLKHKNPQVKQETLKFLIRCLRTTRDVPSKPETKSVADAATKLLTESSEATRSGGAEILGTLMKIIGERAMNPYLDGLDDIRKAKIKEFFETAEVKAKDRPKPIVGPPKGLGGPPPGKRPVIKKAGIKKAAPAAAAAPPPEEPTPAPAAKPASRGIPSKLGGIPKSGGAATPGPGSKLGRKLAGPGGAGAPSPRRVVSPPFEEHPAPAPPAAVPGPKFGLGNRGLAGRSLGRPAPANAEPAPPSANAAISSGMAAIERAELEELRLEKERLSKMVEDMRSERSKLASEINELQNQNAQLIEDHTRDVLSIKAKETQLVRARSDAETAEQNVQKQQREIERLKRELSRAVRASAASPPAVIPDMGLNMGVGDGGIYQDHSNNINNGPPSRAGLHFGSRFESARPRSFMSASPSEEKENNNGLESPGLSSAGGYAGRRKISPPVGSSYSSGRGSPARLSAGRTGSSGDGPLSSGEPAENWKRAAEVTSQLKARIEQMKVTF
ncbi:Microtubule-associated protein, microtubule dynamics during spindle orientation [Onygenales sp. PD_40]|nr:Microtubule-associated protein, microtubule dynamics during spindle orientation [Onygenales sp. PD_40]KAK2776966.1 Microtubule-associated protein, microtubule dynamics during spindle orientation [Emmonsiellopsis sp. PD_33]KAK2781956.1 Microtubule-associated protein, microtubule dynamics during spindle orientation [Onygenales sp. PD_12]KAK2801935.1 Microtubule-associated protein, microtubule dynamics during spindle orientation [Onygenales sp. PD_10]